jgi:GH24 family phage-related lysozyme (muramidase)
MDALSLIRKFEGFRDTPYWDVNALRTGYGSDTVTLADGTVQKVGKDTRVTQEDADRDLARRVQTEFMPIVAKSVGADVFAALPENQKAALTSIAYNYGELPKNVADAVRTGNQSTIVAQIRRLASHNGGINSDRRNLEADVFLGQGQSGGGADSGQASSPPVDKNPQRLAWAYRTGKMTPEDKSLYEKGVAAGVFPDPLETYQRVAQRQPRPMSVGQYQISTPKNWPGLGG